MPRKLDFGRWCDSGRRICGIVVILRTNHSFGEEPWTLHVDSGAEWRRTAGKVAHPSPVTPRGAIL